MGSFQQISIGIVCLIAAFLFGSYVNSHPDPDNLSHGLSELANEADDGTVTSLIDPGVTEQRAAPIETLRSQLANRLPTLKSMSNSRLSLDLPPPSQLDQPVVNDQTPVTPAPMPNLLDFSGRREVAVPDFSRLAAEFKDTPLELPALHWSNSAEISSPVEATKNNGGEVTGESVATVSSEEAETTSAPDFAQSAPQQFLAGAFEPKLKDRIKGSNPMAEIESGLRELAPPSQAPEIKATNPPALAADQPESKQMAPVFNAVRSYQEQPPTKPAFIANDVSTGTDSASPVVRQEADESNSKSSSMVKSQPPYISAKPKIPFGLTEQAKTEFVKLRRRPNSQITLGTSKFKTHKTLRGDTLQRISTRYYGKPDFYLDIYLANQDSLRNPVDVPAGILLKIPVYE